MQGAIQVLWITFYLLAVTSLSHYQLNYIELQCGAMFFSVPVVRSLRLFPRWSLVRVFVSTFRPTVLRQVLSCVPTSVSWTRLQCALLTASSSDPCQQTASRTSDLSPARFSYLSAIINNTSTTKINSCHIFFNIVLWRLSMPRIDSATRPWPIRMRQLQLLLLCSEMQSVSRHVVE